LIFEPNLKQRDLHAHRRFRSSAYYSERYRYRAEPSIVVVAPTGNARAWKFVIKEFVPLVA